MNGTVSAHYASSIGRSGRPGRVLDDENGVTYVAFDDPELAAVHVATDGLSAQHVKGAVNRTELVCSVRPGQELAALFVLQTAVGMARRGWRLAYGSVASNGVAILKHTRIHGFVLTPMPWFEGADYVEGPDGMIDIHFINVLPLTDFDIAKVNAEEDDAFYERINSTDTDLLDVTRTVAI